MLKTVLPTQKQELSSWGSGHLWHRLRFPSLIIIDTLRADFIVCIQGATPGTVALSGSGSSHVRSSGRWLRVPAAASHRLRSYSNNTKTGFSTSHGLNSYMQILVRRTEHTAAKECLYVLWRSFVRHLLPSAAFDGLALSSVLDRTSANIIQICRKFDGNIFA